MTAESDIAAIADGGGNTAAKVRAALTSVLGRADVSYGIVTAAGTQGPIASDTPVQILYGTVEADTDDYFSASQDQAVLPTDGVYLASTFYAASGGGTSAAFSLLVAGVLEAYSVVASGTFSPGQCLSTVLVASAGDVVHNTVVHDVGKTLSAGRRLGIVRIREL